MDPRRADRLPRRRALGRERLPGHGRELGQGPQRRRRRHAARRRTRRSATSPSGGTSSSSTSASGSAKTSGATCARCVRASRPPTRASTRTAAALAETGQPSRLRSGSRTPLDRSPSRPTCGRDRSSRASSSTRPGWSSRDAGQLASSAAERGAGRPGDRGELRQHQGDDGRLLSDARRTRSACCSRTIRSVPPRAFRLALSRPMGTKRGKGERSFVLETRKQTIDFYRDLVQDLRPWRPRLRSCPTSGTRRLTRQRRSHLPSLRTDGSRQRQRRLRTLERKGTTARRAQHSDGVL